MFGSIGLPELILIFVIALLLFGPKKLPDIGRTVGKALSEFRKASNDLKRSLEEEVAADDLRKIRTDLHDVAAPISLPEAKPSEPVAAAPPVERQQGERDP
ncbi:MAG: Sec-independent protein translocase protein TatB [Acidobacteriota bacterium]